MPLKSRVDAKKTESERLQAIVVDLLREEENKYCADCEAKQPRWASWNLGVFLCIRCAGIHRNLGVHLTKVKSVNLDSWTPEQVQSMRVMGNKMARLVYEAELPEHFRRPQTDSALESFIRAKYEQKRYILKNWSPPPLNVDDLPPPLDKKQVPDRNTVCPVRSSARERDHCTDLVTKTRNMAGISNTTNTSTDIKGGTVTDVPLLDLSTPMVDVINTQLSPNLPAAVTDKNILGLNNCIVGNNESNEMEDFGPIVSAPPAKLLPDVFVTDAVASSSNVKSSFSTGGVENNLEDLTSVLQSAPAMNEKKSTSDILALYGTASKFYPCSTKHQRRMQQLSEVSSVDNKCGELVNTYLSNTSNVGPSVVPQRSFGSRNGLATESGVLSSSQTISSKHTDMRPKKIPSVILSDPADFKDGFAALSNIQPKSDDGGNNFFVSHGTAEKTWSSTMNQLMGDFGEFDIRGESKEQNNLKKNISWN